MIDLLWGVHCYCSYCPRCGTANGAGHRFCAAHIDRQAGTQKEAGPVRATLRIGDGDAQRLRHLDIRQTFNIVKDEGGAVVQRQLVDRRGQRHAQFGLARWVMHARRPVGDWRGVLAVLVEHWQHLIERDFATSTGPVAKLLVSGIGDDPVEPGAEGRLTPERVDLPDHGPERVLHDFLGVSRVSRDAAREAIRAVAVTGDETLRGGWLSALQRLHEKIIAIDSRRSRLTHRHPFPRLGLVHQQARFLPLGEGLWQTPPDGDAHPRRAARFRDQFTSVSRIPSTPTMTLAPW